MSAIAADKSTEEVLNRIKALETSMEAREKQISKIEKKCGRDRRKAGWSWRGSAGRQPAGREHGF